jgi:maltose O-acetyltransferase
MATEHEKMLRGELYNPMDKELVALRMRARRICERINSTPQSKLGDRKSQFESLLGKTGNGFYIESSFQCDYGGNIHLGDNFYANFGCVVLDVASVTFGDNCKLGPQVGIYTATHPIDPFERARGLEFAQPITIGDHVWIGGNATLLPGIVLGNNTVVGAGAVVSKSFPEGNIVIGGNPARIIKNIPINKES